jgi:3-hydroxybutyryl-CoA dehydratase
MSGPWPAFPEVTHVVDQQAIDVYAALSGDFNPLHVDPAYAKAGPFGTVVAHGPIGLQAVFEAITSWLGLDRLPPGVLVDVAYRGPVRVGDAITCTGGEPSDHAGALAVRVTCVNQRGEEVLQALIVAPRSLLPR